MSQTVHPHDLTLHLHELFEKLTAFQTILENESQQLQQHDIEALVSLLPKKQTASENINQLVLEIEAQFGLPSNLNELASHSNFVSQPQPTQQTLIKIIELAESCKNLNMRNGITIQALDNINAQLTNLFTDHSATPVSLYNASGVKKQSGGHKATLGKA
ncbi:MAG: flagellar export chaperone FlgN [Thiomicrospira sp.]|uniref:flagellar export chaperone FlgN n=1 Tax=Thiomicrospira sp. TaxID=935 RepID=UPI0019DFB06F|nr:flagellar export chaperone FlgN [Thiomicrospira sp.]MBE0494211.1 flagellar export chaperone FlgN [Thiomicrospira sp.]